jgi:hypothetical protein
VIVGNFEKVLDDFLIEHRGGLLTGLLAKQGGSGKGKQGKNERD